MTQSIVLSPGPISSHQQPLGLEVPSHTCSSCCGICCKKREWSGPPMQRIKRRKSEWQHLSTPGRQKGRRVKVTERGWPLGRESAMTSDTSPQGRHSQGQDDFCTNINKKHTLFVLEAQKAVNYLRDLNSVLVKGEEFDTLYTHFMLLFPIM